jgi:ABC-type multidrug transport system permease subunit
MTRFENHVPGLLLVSIILLVFGVAIAVTREIEANTMLRLKLTHLGALEFLGAYTLTYLVVGILSILLTLVTAYLLGFESCGTVTHDILPPTHAVTSLKKLLIYGSRFDELAYEMISLLLVSAVYFASGVLVFKRRHFR